MPSTPSEFGGSTSLTESRSDPRKAILQRPFGAFFISSVGETMITVNALREQRTALAKDTRNLLDQHPGKLWTKVQQDQYDEKTSEIERIDAEIKRVQRQADIDADNAVQNAIEQVSKDRKHDSLSAQGIYSTFVRQGQEGLSAEQRQVIRNTMSTTTNSQGGYSVQSAVAKELIDSLKDYSGVRQVAEVFQTATGAPLSYPTSDGTSETGELIGENTTATASDPSFSTVSLNTFKYSSKIIAVPFELLQDTQIDMEAFIRRRIGDRIGRITNTHFTTGTGSGQPNGVVTAAGSGKVGTTGQTLTVIVDDLIDVVHSINIAYRRGGNLSWMLADVSFAKVRKLKDTAGRPIFIPGWDGLGKTMPDQILGYPVQVNDDVAVMAANAKSILFGNFNYYKVRDAMEVTLFRFTDSAYAKLGQVGFLAWMRCGGNLVDAAAVKYYQNSAT
jgi:HK97 family phage major capsid protein